MPKPTVGELKRGRGDKMANRALERQRQRSAEAQSSRMDAVVWLDLDQIIVDDTIQVRVAGLDDERVQQYALVMVEAGGWGEFPPLDVFRDPETDDIYLAGGFHRRAAVDVAEQGLIEGDQPPITQVPCIVRPGDRQAAIEFAEEDNLQHGLNLSNRDKKAIYARRITEGHIWAKYSNRRIASDLGVSEYTIRSWKNELGAMKNAPERRIGRDGKSYPAQSGAADDDQPGDSSESDRAAPAQRLLPSRPPARQPAGQRATAPDLPLSGNGYQIDEPEMDDLPVDEPYSDKPQSAVIDDSPASPVHQPLREYQVLVEQLGVIAEATGAVIKIQPAMLTGRLTADERRHLCNLITDIIDWFDGYESGGQRYTGLLDHIAHISQVLKDEAS